MTESSGRKNLVLAAMIFAVAMTFIDQTIVSIAVPNVQRELGLSATGVQWMVNAYLLSLAAFFAFGGRLSDIVGHRKMVVLGVVVFAASSAMCGLTPKGSYAEAWIVTFRVVQGIGGALMYPAALAIVVGTFELRERGKALAVFFGIAGGLTAIGPILGGYLTEWTWRAIFWVNIPVAVIALVLIAISKPVTAHKRAPLDYPGAVLIAVGVGLSVFGFQQSALWSWSNPGVWACIIGGLIVLVVFYRYQQTKVDPLIKVAIFRVRAFFVENLVLFITMLVFISVFFFSSEYAQISLGDSASEAGLYLLFFFIGFAVAAQVGGRMLDKGGAKRPVVLGCVIAAVGFFLWARQVTHLEFHTQEWDIIIAGAGMGMMLGPANTDAVSRASRVSYGEATGITQTVRNYAGSLGLAVLGSILVIQERSRLTSSLRGLGLSPSSATSLADTISESRGGSAPHSGGAGSALVAEVTHAARLDFAYSVRTVLYIMAGIMAAGAVVALLGLERGRQAETDGEEGTDDTGLAADGVGPGGSVPAVEAPRSGPAIGADPTGRVAPRPMPDPSPG
jgi:EmrB/QacA subfamily drug resistance transporter